MANSYITHATLLRESVRLHRILEYNRQQKKYYYHQFNKYHRLKMREGNQLAKEVLTTFYQEMFNHFCAEYFEAGNRLEQFAVVVGDLFPKAGPVIRSVDKPATGL